MNDHSAARSIFEVIGGLVATLATLWAGIRYILQPAYKIAQAEERTEQYKLTADAYKERIDALMARVEDLTLQVCAQIERTDLALFYIADRLAWEARGRVGIEPMLPAALEASLYALVARRVTHKEEAPKPESPFPSAP